jgi:dolichol-phosphate mannosyltransferase
MLDLVVVMPTYNEKANLAKLLPDIKSVFHKMHLKGGVLIVDDNSPDGTGLFVDNQIKLLSDRNFFIDILNRSGKLGLGTAYKDGYNKVITERNPEYILGMDADFSHDPKYIPEIYNTLKQNDMVIGSRYVPGGGTQNWGWIRRMVSRMAMLYCKIILGWGINDPTTAFTGFRTSGLKKIDYNFITAKNNGFLIEIKYLAFLKKFRIKEIPIIFPDRIHGKSKFSGNVFSEGIINTFKIKFKYLKHK